MALINRQNAKFTLGSMAAALLALLSQQTPKLATGKALILTGLQHDFFSPEGKLPINNLDSEVFKRTEKLVNEFRQHGDVIWIRTEIDTSGHLSDVNEVVCSVITSLDEQKQSEDETFSSDTAQPPCRRKPCKDNLPPMATQGTFKCAQHKASFDGASTNHSTLVDEENFLRKTAERETCFVKGTLGAEYAFEVKPLIKPTDLHIEKAFYSAFSSTSLLSTLRMKLITELYVCGAMTNLDVFQTSMDAAQHGIKITLVEDCLGYRQKERHDLAIKRLVDIMDARITTSIRVIAEMKEATSPSLPSMAEFTNTHTTRRKH